MSGLPPDDLLNTDDEMETQRVVWPPRAGAGHCGVQQQLGGPHPGLEAVPQRAPAPAPPRRRRGHRPLLVAGQGWDHYQGGGCNKLSTLCQA